MGNGVTRGLTSKAEATETSPKRIKTSASVQPAAPEDVRSERSSGYPDGKNSSSSALPATMGADPAMTSPSRSVSGLEGEVPLIIIARVDNIGAPSDGPATLG
ncbi:unnamed protein product, partial [Polarella glacialis]